MGEEQRVGLGFLAGRRWAAGARLMGEEQRSFFIYSLKDGEELEGSRHIRLQHSMQLGLAHVVGVAAV